MRIVFGKDAKKGALPGRRVVTVGMFDGVHLGHRKTISTTMDMAHDRGCEAAVLTFDRHPASVLSGSAPPHITSLRHRLFLFQELGPDLCVVLHFDKGLANTSARDFLADILVGTLGAEAVVLGQNSTFGKGGEGDFAFLQRVGPEFGVAAHRVALVRLGEQIVSSTAVREAIRTGDLESAEAMLGRHVSLLGTVVHGDKMGVRLGFPTANLDLHHELRPPRGVYAAQVSHGGRTYDAVMNIGVRPTLDRAPEERVEVHLIGFEGHLWNEDLEVRLIARLRDEARFDSLDELAAQIRKDCEDAVKRSRAEKKQG